VQVFGKPQTVFGRAWHMICRSLPKMVCVLPKIV